MGVGYILETTTKGKERLKMDRRACENVSCKGDVF